MTDLIASVANVYRDWTVNGVPASGTEWDPVKSEIRALLASVITSSQAVAAAGGTTVFKASLSDLTGDLAHDAGVIALVYQDATAANNDFYLKSGASGSGTWSALGLIIPSSLASQISDIASAYASIDAQVTAAIDASTTAVSASNSAVSAYNLTVNLRDQVIAAADAIGPVHFYDTYSAAESALSGLTDGDVIEVFSDETQGNLRTRYAVASGALILKITLNDFVKPSADSGRNWATITAPNTTVGAFIDNVLAIQNQSIGLSGSTEISGNAAINFLDRAGTERCAFGYSRNAALAPTAGYFPNLLYAECGNPFTTDAQTTNFAVVVTIAAGGPYWSGSAVSYKPIEITSANGDFRLRANGSNITAEDNFYVGLQSAPVSFASAMTNSFFRIRERIGADQVSLATNISDMASGSTLTQDDSSLPSWDISFGAALDNFAIKRAAAGATNISQYVTLFHLTSTGDLLLGADSEVPYQNARLTIDADNSVSGSAIAIKGVTDATFPIGYIWQPATTGDNQFFHFGTESSFTFRGSITYNRSSGVMAYNTTSDYRAKEIYGGNSDARERILSLRVYRGKMLGATIEMPMLIAHEAQEVMPWAVSGEKDAVRCENYLDGSEVSTPIYQQLDYSKIIPDAISHLQYLDGIADDHENRISTLEGKTYEH